MSVEPPLSEVPPSEFVKARDALARVLRESGKAEEARRISALRRPSVVLWTVNQLGRNAPDSVKELIASTRRARQAQVHGQGGDELRDAMRSQREALHRLVAGAEQVAAGGGMALTLEQKRRIQDTVQTAAATEPEALRLGTLQQELSAAGFNALLSGTGTVTAKAASRKQAFVDRVEEQKRRVSERREQALRERELRQAQLAAKRLAGQAEQLEHVARQAKSAADKAAARAEEARTAANAAAARLLQLHQKT
jgi:hypothetical protein